MAAKNNNNNKFIFNAHEKPNMLNAGILLSIGGEVEPVFLIKPSVIQIRTRKQIIMLDTDQKLTSQGTVEITKKTLQTLKDYLTYCNLSKENLYKFECFVNRNLGNFSDETQQLEYIKDRIVSGAYYGDIEILMNGLLSDDFNLIANRAKGLQSYAKFLNTISKNNIFSNTVDTATPIKELKNMYNGFEHTETKMQESDLGLQRKYI